MMYKIFKDLLDKVIDYGREMDGPCNINVK